MHRDIQPIISQFQIHGDFIKSQPYGSGHINDTYKITFNQGGTAVNYILQRINHFVFRHPPQMMDNIFRMTTHIRKKLQARGVTDISRRVLSIVTTRTNTTYFQDEEENYWRIFNFIEGAKTLDVLETLDQAYEAARMFGEFLELLSDLPLPPLHDTIHDFHNAPVRYREFQRVLENDGFNRAREAKTEIDFLTDHSSLFNVLADLTHQGAIPLRATHNDTKINNVMFDRKTNRGMCIIDLDTAMLGLSLFDFGDLVRTTISPAAEDEADLSKVGISMDRFEAIVKGFLSSVGGLLNDTEINHLITGAKMMTLLIGTRFLMDFLSGDCYFKVARVGHNLHRCRVQFKLVQLMLQQEERMVQIVGNAKKNMENSP